MSPLPLAGQPSHLTSLAANGLALHPAGRDLPDLPLGPFVRRDDGVIVAVDEHHVRFSLDEGATWRDHPIFTPAVEVRPERALLHTRRGSLVLAFADSSLRHWTWRNELKDAPGARMPTFAARSGDGGETWTDVQKLHDEWTGAIRDIKQLASGRIVFTTMKMLHHPGRHSVLTYASDDEGRSWTASNVIDLGGVGHHGGVTESTIIERRDGSLLMYLRTNWGCFWRAISDDGGLYWHPQGPADVDASSAPGLLWRMASGRIALVWNRQFPEGRTSYPLRGGDGLWSATPVSNFRAELTIAFSEDEGESWSQPVVIARDPKGGWISYPYLFEPQPGTLWITCMQGGLRMAIDEADVLRP